MATISLLEVPTPTQQCTYRVEAETIDRQRRPFPMVFLNVVLVLIAGGMHAWGWVFPGNWAPVWIGQAAFVLLGSLNAPRRAFVFGFFGGALGIAISFHWGIAALQLTIDANRPLAYAIFAALVTFEGLSSGIFCLLVAWFARRGLAALALAPFAYSAVEAWYPRLFPWQMGYSQLEILPLLQIAELTGSIGVGFVMTAVAAIPAFWALAIDKPAITNQRRLAAMYSLAAIGLLATTWIYGEIRCHQWNTWMAEQQKLKVALVQVDPAYMGSEEKLRRLTLPICDQVDLICWPESSIGVYSEDLQHFRDRALTTRLSRDSYNSLEPGKEFGRHLLAGGKLYRRHADDHGPYSMTAFLIGPDQGILGRYYKRTLLPFGEYVPLQSFYPAVREWFTLRDVIEAGTDPSPLTTAEGHKLGVLVCYEDTRLNNARQTVARGGRALFSLIQGTAFENPLTLRQHQRLAAMRAVENRRYFVRCASTGVTCIIAPTGKITGELPMQTEGVLLGEIALNDSRSTYTRFGNTFAWFCTGVVLIGLWGCKSRRDAKPR